MSNKDTDTIGLFIFRKDLRIHDNLSLIQLSKKCSKIIPIFILDPYQVDITKHNQYYRSDHAIQFMCESLVDLYHQLDKKLIIFFDSPLIILKEIFAQLTSKYKKVIVGFNLDFTEYALKRDKEILTLCSSHHIETVNIDHDHTLLSFDNIIKKDKTAYLVFNSFLLNAKKIPPKAPIQLKYKNFIHYEFKKVNVMLTNKLSSLYTFNPNLAQRGGRSVALAKMHQPDVLKKYADKRNLLSFHTYRISAYLNFGCISIREFYTIIKKNHTVTQQLYWRDFYHCILRYMPRATSYIHCIDPAYDKIKWNPQPKYWEKLMQAKTGFLIIDASMRELIQTGYTGNRNRLLLGTFWIKQLLIHPLHPKYGSNVGFSKYLVDCNASQNKLNHQWLLELDRYRFAPAHQKISGRPFRTDNEMIKKYDKDCEYIKQWLPELNNIPNKDLYHWNQEVYKKYKCHVPPMFDWKDQYQAWLAASRSS